MKKILLCISSCLLLSTILFAQSVGINTTAPHASAILDIKSNTKGMLVPRTSTSSRLAIVNPAKGLMVYDTTANSFWFYNGASWGAIAAGSIGWSLTGNAGTNPATHFIGTTDSQSVRFRVNNLWAGEMHPANGNLFLGLGAGKSITSGRNNTAIGSNALFSNTTGLKNTATGGFALHFNSTGNYNTATGQIALYKNTIGVGNTANGYAALYSDTSGSGNTATGGNALYSNITGNGNVAAGNNALYSNTTGNYNTAIGTDAMLSNEAGENTAVGYQSLYSNTSGIRNTANGFQALYSNTTGVNNTANGANALFSNTTGESNTANGLNALYSNTAGYGNTANGRVALYYNTTGTGNTANGLEALSNNKSGGSNTANGTSALGSNTTGSYNTAFGASADVASGNLNHATAIGIFAIANATDKVVIGQNIGGMVIGGYAGWSNLSDGRFKENIKEDVPGLAFINQLRPVTYWINTDKLQRHITAQMPDSIAQRYLPDAEAMAKDKEYTNTGFVAQEVEASAKAIGYAFDGVNAPKNPTDNYSIAYGQFVPSLVRAVQEQQTIIETLQKQVETAKNKIPIEIGKQQSIIEEQNKKIELLLKEIKEIKEQLNVVINKSK